MVTTVLSVVLILYGTFLDAAKCLPDVKYNEVAPGDVVLSLGNYNRIDSSIKYFLILLSTPRHKSEFSIFNGKTFRIHKNPDRAIENT